MRVGVVGCAHGELDAIFARVASGPPLDVLLVCGDFQAVRNQDDLACMACPDKFKRLNNFYKYHAEGGPPVPLTVLIGGNHEASNYMQELFYGGWVAPRMYYLGAAGVVRVGGLRVAGLSGIYNASTWARALPRFEMPPYAGRNELKTAYNVRQLQVQQLGMLEEPLDVFMSHDWPRNIVHHGDLAELLRIKRFLRKEIADGSFGNAPAERLLRMLRPRYWFAGHMHIRFKALVRHTELPKAVSLDPPVAAASAAAASPAAGEADAWQMQSQITLGGGRSRRQMEASKAAAETQQQKQQRHVQRQQTPVAARSAAVGWNANAPEAPRGEETRFLALDKCLPGRHCLEVLDITVADAKDGPVALEHDPEWLAILMATQEYVAAAPAKVPGPGVLRPAVEAAKKRLAELQVADADLLRIRPEAFRPTAGGPALGDGAKRRKAFGRPPKQQGNPQTDELLAKLGLEHRPPVTVPFTPPAAAAAAAVTAPVAAPVTAPVAAPVAAPVVVPDANEIDLDL